MMGRHEIHIGGLAFWITQQEEDIEGHTINTIKIDCQNVEELLESCLNIVSLSC